MRTTDDWPDHESPSTERDTIVVDDEVMREGFTQVPNILLKRTDISHGAKIAYAMLLSYAWGTEKCFPGQARLAADLGVERKAVIRYLQELKDKGIITVTRRGMGKTNVYRLPRLADVPKMGHQEVPPTGHQEVRSVGQKEYSRKNTQRDESLSKLEGSHDQLSEPKHQDKPAPSRPAALQSRQEPRSAGPAQFSPLGEILKQRETAPTHLANSARARTGTPPSTSSGSTRRTAAYGTTEEREKLYAYLRDFSIELGDEAQLSSSTTQVLKIFHTAHIPMEHWDDHLYRARALTLEHSASIKKRSGDPTRLSGKNKFPYFKKVLMSLVSPPDRVDRGIQESVG
jgi:biotin operon repressor